MPDLRYTPDMAPGFARHHEDGRWLVVGPATVVVEGAELLVDRRDPKSVHPGRPTFVRVGAIVAELTVEHRAGYGREAGPVRYVTAEFVNVPDAEELDRGDP